MAGLNKDQKVELWSRRISAGIAERDDKAAKHWDTALRYLLGDQWSQTAREYSQVRYHSVLNVTWNVVKTYVPALYMNDPYLMVRADPMPNVDIGFMEIQQKAWESLYNKFWRLMNVKSDARAALLDCICMTYCTLKVGYYDVPQDTYAAISTADRLRNQQAYIRRVDPFDIAIDPTAKKLNGGRWVAESFIRPYADVMDDSTIQRSIRDKIKPSLYSEDLTGRTEISMTPPTPTLNQSIHLRDELRDRDGWVRFWEVTTLEDEGRILTFVEKNRLESGACPISLDTLIRDEDRPYREYLDTLHYFHFAFNEIPNTLYGPSDIEMMMDQQDELNYLRSVQMDRVRQSKAVWVVNTLVIDNEKAKMLEEAPDMSIVGVEGPVPPDTLQLVQTPPVGQDLYIAQQQARDAAWDAAGMDLASQNQPMKGETATASMQRGQQMGVRMMDRSLLWEDYLTRVANAWAQVMFHESPIVNELQYLMIDGVDGRPMPVQFLPSACPFKQNFIIKLESSNTFPITRQVELAQAMQFLNLVQNNPRVNSFELIKIIAERMNIKPLNKILPPLNIPPELLQILENFPDFQQKVVQAAQQFIMQKQAEAQAAQQGGGQGVAASAPQGGLTDQNAYQQNESPANQTSASMLSGGGGANYR